MHQVSTEGTDLEHYLFVYGTLMKGMGNSDYLDEAEFIGKAETKDKYRMTATFIPFLHDGEGNEETYIKGEVYLVSGKTLRLIDQLEGHPYMYKRKQINVIVEGDVVPHREAFCYMYNQDGKGTSVHDGDYKSYLRMRKNYSSYVSQQRRNEH